MFALFAGKHTGPFEECVDKICSGLGNAANYRSNKCNIKMCGTDGLQIATDNLNWQFRVLYKVSDF